MAYQPALPRSARLVIAGLDPPAGPKGLRPRRRAKPAYDAEYAALLPAACRDDIVATRYGVQWVDGAKPAPVNADLQALPLLPAFSQVP
jgi:hypothetical protein